MGRDAALCIAYASVCLIWLLLAWRLPYWRTPQRPSFPHPWTELGYVAIAIVLVVLLGQAYTHGIRVPDQGAWRPLTESINQLVIFAPIVLLPVGRRQGWDTAWLPQGGFVPRLSIGLGLSLVALTVYTTLEAHAPTLSQAMAGVYSIRHAHIAVQVLLEDAAIAIVLVRLSSAVTAKWAILGTAALFAIAHIPAMLVEGASLGALTGLVRDMGLGVLVLATAWRGADILWLWPVHTVLDLTQFLAAA